MVDHSIVISPDLKLDVFDFRLYEEYKMLENSIATFVQNKRFQNFEKNE
jgi:hypothetical protein